MSGDARRAAVMDGGVSRRCSKDRVLKEPGFPVCTRWSAGAERQITPKPVGVDHRWDVYRDDVGMTALLAVDEIALAWRTRKMDDEARRWPCHRHLATCHRRRRLLLCLNVACASILRCDAGDCRAGAAAVPGGCQTGSSPSATWCSGAPEARAVSRSMGREC